MAVYVQQVASQYFEHGSPLVTAVPLSMACFFQSHDDTANSTLMGVFDASQPTDAFALQALGNFTPDDVVSAFAVRGATLGRANTTSSWTGNTWHHACGVFASTTDRRVFLDGGSKGTNATSVIPTNIDVLDLGRSGDSTPGAYHKGYLAGVGIWAGTLTDAEVAILANGTPPDRVQPHNLVHHYDLVNMDNLNCRVGSTTLTAFNTPTSADAHPRIYRAPAPMPFRSPLTIIWLVSGQRWLYTAANWAARSWYFEATFRSLAGGATSRAKLYDITAAADVANSEVTSTSATISRQRSAALTLVDGHEYEARFGSGGGFSAAGLGARLLGVH